MLRKILTAAAAAATTLLFVPAHAADEWGIEHEEVARIEAKVVDIACELTGDCPPDCGAGRRQLGLLLDDGTLVPVVKNFDIFAGATHDLIDFCGKRIVADGLYIKDPLMPMFALQFKREAPDGKWSRANWFIKDWAKRHDVAADDEKASAWYRHDEQIRQIIESDGVFGIPGLKATE